MWTSNDKKNLSAISGGRNEPQTAFGRALMKSCWSLDVQQCVQLLATHGALNVRTQCRVNVALAAFRHCAESLTLAIRRARHEGLNGGEINANQIGSSQDARADLAIAFACKIAAHAGIVYDDDLLQLRRAGYSEAEIVELIVLVSLSLVSGKISVVN